MTLDEIKRLILQHEIRVPTCPAEKFRNSDVYAKEVNLAKNGDASKAAFSIIKIAEDAIQLDKLKIPLKPFMI